MDKYIKNKVEEYLTGEYHCTSDDLNASGTVFTIHAFVPQPYIKIMAYRNAVVVCTSQNISSKIKDMLRGKSRDEIFETPLVYGQTIHYIPDPAYAYQLRKRPGYDFVMLFDEQILSLRGLKGFENSLEFDEHGETPTKAVYAAVENKKVVGVAGVTPTAVPDMWEVGVDVLPEYRNQGIAASLVSSLTKELLDRNIVPFYSASITNIGSQLVAARSGYLPAWVDTYGTVLDGSSVYSEMLDNLTATFLRNK